MGWFESYVEVPHTIRTLVTWASAQTTVKMTKRKKPPQPQAQAGACSDCGTSEGAAAAQGLSLKEKIAIKRGDQSPRSMTPETEGATPAAQAANGPDPTDSMTVGTFIKHTDWSSNTREEPSTHIGTAEIEQRGGIVREVCCGHTRATW